MTIDQIKTELSIESVLSHYGLKADRNDMLCCPFHDDKKASMKIYPKTNTANCFAGGCKVESVDVIDFIMHKEKCSKHEAILICKSLCHQTTPIYQPPPSMPSPSDPQSEFQMYRKSLHRHQASKAYCMSRKLNWRIIEVGYKSRKAVDRWGRGCLIFPLLDEGGQIVSLYGRGIRGSSHYYQSDRSGLYPSYPDVKKRKVILCEAVIDAATWLSLSAGGLITDCSILALYGTNGLTGEHVRAIGLLEELEEIIFAFDGDEAGKEATQKHLQTLSALHGHVRFSQLPIPEGEDINSLAMNHENVAGLFSELLADRQLLKEGVAKVEILSTLSGTPGLDTSDPHNLSYATSLASYYIKGGVRYGLKDLDSLKVTLVVENENGKKSRNKLDMYEDKQIEKVARLSSERLGLRVDLLELDLYSLVDELESYQKQLHEGEVETQMANKQTVGPLQKKACLELLKSKKLLKKLDTLLEQSGVIGEENNRRLGFCIVSSYGMKAPLHGLIQGSSGSGKTHLLSLLSGFVPEENYIPITRATDNSFYNYQSYELKNKHISIEDKDAMSEEANLAFRELQSKGMVSSSTTGQDENGNSRSFIKTVYGPISSLACTTKGELYLDDMNRCFLLAINESEAQTKRVLDYQKRKAAGLIDQGKSEVTQVLIQNCLRLLKPYEVVIPYAPHIHLPETVKDKRRLNSLYLSLVKQLTLLHQYQREKDKQGRLIATKSDLKLANEIMFDAIVLKVDELHGPLRNFYEQLKGYIENKAGQQKEKYEFLQREIRHWMRRGNTYVKKHLRSLMDLEYVQICGGSEHRGYRYQLIYWDDNEVMRSRIQQFLELQIEQLG